jgi:hypothetical protein
MVMPIRHRCLPRVAARLQVADNGMARRRNPQANANNTSHATSDFVPVGCRASMTSARSQLSSPLFEKSGRGDFPSAAALRRNINSPQVVLQETK